MFTMQSNYILKQDSKSIKCALKRQLRQGGIINALQSLTQQRTALREWSKADPIAV
jgi:hypothetical protein